MSWASRFRRSERHIDTELLARAKLGIDDDQKKRMQAIVEGSSPRNTHQGMPPRWFSASLEDWRTTTDVSRISVPKEALRRR